MSYTPTQWSAGDTVTSAKLNKMEQGIAGGANILIAHVIEASQEVDDGGSSGPELRSTSTASAPAARLDKTAREILDADFIIIVFDSQHEMTAYRNFIYIPQIAKNLETGESQLAVPMGNNFSIFYAATEDDYPETISDDETPSDEPTE